MSYVMIENFSRGMDRRRPIYATEQGAVWDIQNGHLSRGGDIEKRKAFVPTYALPAGETVGLAAVGNALYVFGHTTEPTGMPFGVTYSRCEHTSPVSEVLSVNGFDGKPYVVAEHDDAAVRHYYDSAYNAAGAGTYSFTKGSKVYTLDGAVLRFSDVNDPLDFTTGLAGSVNLSNHDEGSESLTSMEVFQGSLGIASDSSIQIWTVGADPLNNVQLQTLRRTGTKSPRSMLSYGDVDTFYLDRTGIRSIRARSNTNTGYVNDVGIAIDSYVQDYLASLTDAQKAKATSGIDSDGRFWMAVSGKVFVLSYYPGSKISGWTWYETGFEVDALAVADGKVYLRSADTIYLYGGASGGIYDQSQVVVQLPFLTAGKPGTTQNVIGMDIAAEGEWFCELLVDPRDLTRVVQFGYLRGNTFLDLNAGGFAQTSHIAPRLTSLSDEFVSLSSIGVAFSGQPNEV